MMRILIPVLVLLCCTTAQADRCKYEKDISSQLDLSASETLRITAVAGDLVIKGSDKVSSAQIKGRACASKEEFLDEVSVLTSAQKNSEISVVVPDIYSDNSYSGNRYVYVDLEVTVPSDLPLEVLDSSGDASIEHVASLSVRDSSGDLEISDAGGAVSIRDSSGSIKVYDSASDVSIEDSSGDIKVVGVAGDLIIEADSSGEIDARQIDGNVHILADGSGSIDIRDVMQNVTIDKDASGDISVDNIDGNFEVGRDGSGSIYSRQVAGTISIPEDKH